MENKTKKSFIKETWELRPCRKNRVKIPLVYRTDIPIHEVIKSQGLL